MRPTGEGHLQQLFGLPLDNGFSAMTTLKLPNATPKAEAFLYEKPDGSRELAAHVLFDDNAVWAAKDDFDGKEQVTLHFPVQGQSEWASTPARYVGTIGGHYDVHSLALSMGGSPSVALVASKMAASAQVNGPRHGAALVHLQEFGDDIPVHDVGKVDGRGINWSSPVTATRISRDHGAPQVLRAGETIAFSATYFGRPGNLRFDIDVFAPVITPALGVDGPTQQGLLNALDIHVQSPFLNNGDKPLRFVNNVGPNGNNARLSVSLADLVVGQPLPPTGVYPMRIMSGGTELAHFNLDWRAN